MSGCLLWLGATTPGGYGQMCIGKGSRLYFTHRIAWELENGPIPAGHVVRHKVCDNPRCCNADHLRLGTMADNTADMIAHDRHSRGERSCHAKLTDAVVAELRRRHAFGEKQKALAKEVGVNTSVLSEALRGITWKHVPGALPSRVKLTEADIRECRRRAAAGDSIRGLARAFGVSPPHMTLIVRGAQ